MATGNLKTPKGLLHLDAYLADKSYIDGYQPTQADVAVYEALGNVPTSANPHVLRWYNHIKSHDHTSLPGEKKAPAVLDVADAASAPPAADDNAGAASAQPANDDDDVDLFGSDEEEDAEAAKVREERLKAYAEKKSKKPTLIAKSSILIDVKPWGDETDLKSMEEAVRSIEIDGLVWGVSKLVPVGYGIKKLQILCVVEDDKVSVDELVEQIQDFEEHVQSVDIAAFNKI